MMKMNMRIGKRLFLVGLALGLVLAGCGDSGEPKSTETAITELTLTIGGVAKTITFGTDGTANVALSESVTSTMPTSATVKSVTLSAGASGLVKDQKLTLTEGSVTVTITAEDGTTKKEYTVTVTIGDKLNLNTVALSYADVTTTAGTANDTGVDPQWVGSPTPEGITYSITNYAPPGGGNGVDGSDGDSPAVAIDADGKITITDAAEAENSGTYTVTATAGASSNYEANTTQTATVTVTIVKRNLGTVTLTYPRSPIKAVAGYANDTGIEPEWTTSGSPTPAGIIYSIDASTTSGPTTDGTEGTPVVAIDESTGKITITVAAEADNSGDYTVTATAGESSNYLKDSTQTFDVTVEITATKASLDTTSFTYTGVETTAGTANDIGVAPVWDVGNPPPVGITYEISGDGTTVVIDTGTGKITITDGAEADNSGEYTVTATASANSNYEANSSKAATVIVTIAKRDLNTATFSYDAVATTEGTAIAAGAVAGPVWTPATGAPGPNGITYSVTGYSGDGEQDAGVGTDADGKITITDAAKAVNSGTYTVTATAGSGSNYADTSTQTTTVTVTIAKRNLNTATFSYATVETNEGVANDAGVEPAWTPPTGAPTPDQITYSIAGTTATANGNTGGTPAVDIDTATGKITITADAVEANSGDYTVEATANQNSSYLNGSKQTTTATVKVIVYNVGDDGPAGGKVFYDEGDYTKGWRYLEAAPSDQGDFAWGGDGDINGGTQDGIGSGKDNTDAIVATLQDNKNKAYAAKICNELVEGGFTDWFLPSKDELNKLYEQKDTLYEQKDTVGVFSYDYYWSSSAYASDSAWVQHFGQGNQNVDTRNLDNRVRAVRAF